jgi:putative transposase
MREPRINPVDRDTWHHCYNHATCTAEDFPFGEVEREKFADILKRSTTLFSIDLALYSVMSNHFHTLVRTRSQAVGEEEAIHRYSAYYPHLAPLVPGSEKCVRWKNRMNNLSEYMKHVQKTFSTWYNRTREAERKGTVWGQRYKNTVLEDGASVHRCGVYVEANPLRAGMVMRADERTQNSCSPWFIEGEHPMSESVEQVLLPLMRDVMRVETMDELKQAFFEELVARQTEAETGAVATATATVAAEATVDRTAETVVSDAEETDAVAQQTAVNANGCEEENVAHTTGTVAVATAVDTTGATDEAVDERMVARLGSMDLNRRMRCWTDGLVIGSEKFVREVMSRARGVPIDSGHRVMKLDTGADRDDLCAWRRLRASGG